MNKIRTGDQVIVLTGRDKGKSGEVLKVMTAENRVLVSGVNMVKRHNRPTQQSAGGIENKEAPIHVSNVMVVDSDGNPTRVGYRTDEETGKRVRISRKNGKDI